MRASVPCAGSSLRAAFEQSMPRDAMLREETCPWSKPTLRLSGWHVASRRRHLLMVQSSIGPTLILDIILGDPPLPPWEPF